MIRDIFDIAGKTALVTGGRRSLGRAMALGLAKAGAKVAVAARSAEASDLERAFADIGAELRYIQIELTDRGQRANLAERAAERLGGLDILVNNAGIQARASAMDYPGWQWDADIELLLTAVFDVSQQAARIMAAAGGGKIVHIASISSFQGARGIIGYATAKHGLVGMTKCMANEWASLGINVNAIAPGLFDTDMAAHVFADPVKKAEMLGRIPAGRFGAPEDIVGPLLFLVSEASRHVHGHVLLVDGGWMGR
jgi:2-deoxy-D-gluconate 3-dehydrogenase